MRDAGWAVASVAELERAGVLLVQDGNHGAYRPRPHEIVEHGIPHIRAADVTADGTIDFVGAQQLADTAWQRIRKGRAYGRDTLLTHKGTVGRVATAPATAAPFLCSPQTTLWRSLDRTRLDQGYIAAFLRSQPLQEQLQRVMHESDMAPYVSLTSQRGLLVPVPPVPEQRAIASVLGALDGKIESNRRVASAADSLWLSQASTVFTQATPTAVASLVAAGVLIINDGYRAKNSELADHGVPFIRAGSLTNDGLRLDGSDRVPPEVVARAGIKVATAWDSAFTSKGTVGRITLVGPDPALFVYSPQVCFWRTTDPEALSPFVLHAWMRSVHFTAQIDAVKGQTDMADYVSLRDQRAMEFLVPSTQDQRRVSLLAEPLACLAVAKRAEAQTLAAIRDALLPKLVSGQIRVPLSDDPEEAVGAAVEALGAVPA